MTLNKDNLKNEDGLKIKMTSSMRMTSKMRMTLETKTTGWGKLPFRRFSHTAVVFSALLYF